MPEWRVADAKFGTKSEGTFVKVKSVEVTRVSGQASYADNQIDLDADLADATARAEDRWRARAVRAEPRAVGGDVAAHDRGRDMTLPAGTTAVASRRRHEVEVKDLTLTKDAQRVSADGVFALTPKRRRPPPACASGSNRYSWRTQIASCSAPGVSKAS